MRNLKKILALALSLVMMLSVMSVASAAFTDSADITGNYVEAVNVLTGLGVLKGYEDGSVKPQGDITRAEVAAMIYRVATLDVADKQAGIYSDYGMFTDVASNAWYAGYVGYCANALYIKGYGDGTFGPSDNVTGYQALAMVLRALGYDQNNEFGGDGWELRVASTAQSLGILKNVSTTTLGAAADRELVAEIIFQAMQCEKVKYSLGFNYTEARVNTMMEDFGAYKVAGVVVNTAVSNTSTTFANGTVVYGTDADWQKVGYGAYVWAVKGVAITDVIVTSAELAVSDNGLSVEYMTYKSAANPYYVASKDTNGVAYYLNGEVSTEAAVNAANKIGTKVVMNDVDHDGDVDTVVATTYTAAMVTKVQEKSVSGVVSTYWYGLTELDGTGSATVYPINLAWVDALALYDYVAYTVVDGDYYVTLLTATLGEFKSITRTMLNGENVRTYNIDGTGYVASQQAGATVAALVASNLNEDVVYVLDQYGYIVDAYVYQDSDAYLFVVSNDDDNSVTGLAETEVVYTDGSVEIVDVAANVRDNALAGDIYSYVVKNGAYVLTDLNAEKLTGVNYNTNEITMKGVALSKSTVLVDLRGYLAGTADAGVVYTGWKEIPSVANATVYYLTNGAGTMTLAFMTAGQNAADLRASFVVFDTTTNVVSKLANGAYTYELTEGVLINGVLNTNYVLSEAQKAAIDTYGVGVYSFGIDGSLASYTSFSEDTIAWTPYNNGTYIKDGVDVTDSYDFVTLNVEYGEIEYWWQLVNPGTYYAYFDKVNKVVYVVGDATVGTAGLLAAGSTSTIDVVDGKSIGYYVADGKVTNVVEVNAVATAAELTSAIAAGGTVVLAADIELSSYLTITKSITIDLNGKSIECTGNTGLYVNDDAVTLTLTGNGTVSAVASAVRAAKGTVVIDGGTYSASTGLYVEGTAKATVNNGTFTGNKRGVCAAGNSKVTINDGTFTSTGTSGDPVEGNEPYAAIINVGNAVTTIVNGTFAGEIGVQAQDSAKVSIDGGTFNGTIYAVFGCCRTEITINGGITNGTVTRAAVPACNDTFVTGDVTDNR